MVVPTKLITAEVHVEPHVAVAGSAKKVSVAVRAELRNDSEHDVVLHVPGDDSDIFWHVLDRSQKEIQRFSGKLASGKAPRLPKAVESFRSVTVAAGHSLNVPEKLSLDIGKLKNGETYTVRAELLGQPAEAKFIAVVVDKPAAKKKAAKKRKKTKKKSGK